MRSILESDLFIDREQERERMMRMFTNEKLPDSINDRAGNNGDNNNNVSDSASSINDRLADTNNY